jgi:hypothetical protein
VKRLIEFPLEEGGSIVVEVDEPAPEGGVVRAARPGEVAAKAGQTFEAAREQVDGGGAVSGFGNGLNGRWIRQMRGESVQSDLKIR